MSGEAPLVKGGVLGGISYGNRPEDPPLPSHATFTTTCPPVVEKDTIIIGIASTNFEASDPVNLDGWFLSDFYAFNYLFKGLGSEQVWISSVHPRKLVDAPSPRGRYLHGNPYKPRKVVLSKELLDQEEITLPTVVPRPRLQETFLREVREKSEKAAKQNAPLLLLVFCHGYGRMLMLGASEKRKGLKPSVLNEAIHPRCRVTMLNTACYSGGWVVSVPGGISLNVTAMTAADQDSQSNSWCNSPSIGRHCGSPWASAVIETLLSTSSPFLAQPTTREDSKSLEPDNPTGQQMETYNSFCQTVLDTCMDRISRWSNKETFTFSAQDDKWNWPWGQRTGIPFDQEHLRARWEALETYEPQMLECDPDDPFPEWHQLDPDPRNPKITGIAGSCKTGGLNPMDEFALSEARHDAISMAKAFLETCPNDWCRGYGINAKGVLNRLIQGGKPSKASDREEGDVEVNPMAMMRFRWEAAQDADNLVARFRLPVPDNEHCLMWDEYHSLDERRSQIPGYSTKYSSAFQFIISSPIDPEPTEIQGYRFPRIVQYIATAVALANLSTEKQDELLKSMLAFVMEQKKLWVEPIVQIASKKRSIRERGREYISQVNKRLRLRSLSPLKRHSASSTPRRGRSESKASSVSYEDLIASSPKLSPVPSRRSTDDPRRSFDLRRSFDRPS